MVCLKSKASAPGKIILFGEHFVVYGVKAILCAINKRITVTAETVNERKISIQSNIGNLILSPNKSINEINSPLKPLYYLADKMLKTNQKFEGIKIDVKSDFPSGVGLGSSSACCVAGAAAISGLFSKKSLKEICDLAIEAEKTIFENTSGADCNVCTYGGIMEFDKKNGHRKIDLEPNFDLIITNSDQEHSTQSAVEKVKQYQEQNKDEFLELCNKETELIEEVFEILSSDNTKELGDKINLNQKFLEKIGVSNQKLRNIIDLGKKFSYGSKITGAGIGGCIFSLVNEKNLEELVRIYTDNGYQSFPIEIDFKGLNTF